MPKLTNKKEDKSTALAIVRNAEDKVKNGEIIYFDEEDRQGVLKVDNLYDYVSDKQVRSHKRYMNVKEMMQIKDSFEKGHMPHGEIKDIYDRIKPEVEKQVSKHIRIHDGTFEVVPMVKENQTERVFIAGASGVGKSTWIATYAKNYKKIFPDNEVYVISRHDTDDVIDKVGVKRIPVNEELLEVEINLEDLKNSLIIMDDIDTIPSKRVRDLVSNLKDDLLENSRHQNIYLCIVSHQALNYKSTRALILESNMIVFFPRSGSYQIKRLLKEYLGLDKKNIELIMNVPSRWVAVNRSTYPNSYICENDIYIL